MTDTDPQTVIARTVYALMPGGTYPRPLPAELAPWYCATGDAGHCIAVVVQSLAGQ
ncbi:hypothetical protein [Streptomyces sp. NPDC026673]|uniref:hypothetical protein n=1 Tax=Streptomyces sp. NPDC026673 TaxID=3155724 RepID=UPI0033F54440